MSPIRRNGRAMMAAVVAVVIPRATSGRTTFDATNELFNYEHALAA